MGLICRLADACFYSHFLYVKVFIRIAVRRGAAAVVGARARGGAGDAHGAGVAQGARRAAAPAAGDLHARQGPAADAIRGHTRA